MASMTAAMRPSRRRPAVRTAETENFGMHISAAWALVISLISSAAVAADSLSRDPTRIPAGSYVLDKRHARLVVKAPLVGFSRYTMRFTRLDGSFSFDPARWQGTKVAITVDPRSIDTANDLFNKVVSGYFEPDKHPVIRFTSSGLIADAQGRGRLRGDLTLHGVTRPITLDVEFKGVSAGRTGAGARMGFSGSGTIRRSEFGVNGGRPWAGDRIKLIFDVEFVKE